MSHDVFISYSNKDKAVADAACAALEARGVRCWIAPRDVLPGRNWGEAIVDAIGQARVMVLIYSAHANASTQVQREVERAASKDVVIVPFRVENAPLTKAMEYFLSTPHWLDAFPPPAERHFGRLVETVQRLLAPGAAVPKAGSPPPPPAAAPAAPRRGLLLLTSATLLLLIAAAAALLWHHVPELIGGGHDGGGGGRHADSEDRPPTTGAADPAAPAPAAPATTVTLTQVIPAQAQAEMAFERLREVDRGHGFGDALDRAEAARREAQAYLDRQAFAEAKARYESLSALAKEIAARDAARRGAGDQIAQADAAAGAARAAGAEREARPLWAGAAQLLSAARKSLEAGQFEEARADAAAAAEQYKNAEQVVAAERERVAREAEAQAQRRRTARIAQLLTTARTGDANKDAKAAMAALDELLALDPANAEARRLREKVSFLVARNYTNSLEMKFVRIEPGKFMMGTPLTEKDRDNDETLHKVSLVNPFLMGAHEVTRGQFAAFVKDTGYQTDAERSGGLYVYDGKKFKLDAAKSWRDPGFPQGDDHPAVGVSWNDAVAFAQWLSKKEGRRYRLPTEAEWEYACRAGAQTAYPWGDDPDAGRGWCNAADLTAKEKFNWAATFNWDDGFAYTAPVGSFRANAFGLHDMIGNVWEWCADWYDAYPAGDAVNPTGPANPPAPNRAFRVLRGGSWATIPRGCRAGYRNWYAPDYRHYNSGFRLCLDFE